MYDMLDTKPGQNTRQKSSRNRFLSAGGGGTRRKSEGQNELCFKISSENVTQNNGGTRYKVISSKISVFSSLESPPLLLDQEGETKLFRISVSTIYVFSKLIQK